mmetsp:Transcript_35125/g.83298  ORF Transcript_35125/g.83298 Transcript_35125/m.83298 type:complete len:215 (+) Transcript_35125:1746-2390(+)
MPATNSSSVHPAIDNGQLSGTTADEAFSRDVSDEAQGEGSGPDLRGTAQEISSGARAIAKPQQPKVLGRTAKVERSGFQAKLQPLPYAVQPASLRPHKATLAGSNGLIDGLHVSASSPPQDDDRLSPTLPEFGRLRGKICNGSRYHSGMISHGYSLNPTPTAPDKITNGRKRPLTHLPPAKLNQKLFENMEGRSKSEESLRPSVYGCAIGSSPC